MKSRIDTSSKARDIRAAVRAAVRAAIFAASAAAFAALRGLIAWIPLMTAIAAAIGFLEAKTDYIRTY